MGAKLYLKLEQSERLSSPPNNANAPYPLLHPNCALKAFVDSPTFSERREEKQYLCK